MDDAQLKKMMGTGDIPPADTNARKVAVNLALAAFDEAQREKETNRHKKFQGFRIWDRLRGRNDSIPRRRPMKKRFVFGGVATATALIIGVGVYGPPDQNPSPQPAVIAEANVLADAEARNTTPEAGAKTKTEPPSSNPRLSVHEQKEKDRIITRQNTAPLRPQAALSSDGLPRKRPQNRRTARFVPLPSDTPRREFEAAGRDQFADVEQNGVLRVIENPVSTFSIDVDTASYSFTRRMLNRGRLPQKSAVRIEELVNYFHYDYPLAATRERPFKPTISVLPSPWKKGNKLIHIGIKGYDLKPAEKPRSNLVFLIDVSGSMRASDKLPLAINAMKLLLETLKPGDTIAIVTYAGAAGTVLEPTMVSDKHKILAALDRLNAGGSTAGAAGIRQAYALAEGNFDKSAVNRVILATDGDFNVGITDPKEFKDFVERKRKSGIYLSVLGFGQGNLNDRMMQTLAQNGNGAAAHIDTLNEARKVLVEEAASTLFPIAKDVKIQVEFNPKTVAEYRLIGYETRALKREDFKNDNVDAGDIGAGHTVTAIYELTPVGGQTLVSDSRYLPTAETNSDAGTGSRSTNEYAFLKIRYKKPDSDRSQLISVPVTKAEETRLPAKQLREARWAIAVAAYGQILKGGKYTGNFSYDDVITMARTARGDDEYGYRTEFINLVRLARSAAALPGK